MKQCVKQSICWIIFLLCILQSSGQAPHRVSSEDGAMLREKAKSGDAQAQFRLGIAYMDGIGVKHNLRKSEKWFAASAAQDYGPAQYKLAQCLTYGIGVESNLRRAALWYRKASEKGIADAQYYYGLMLLYGSGTDKNEAQGLKWVKAAEAQGHLEATFRLGMHYYNQIVDLDNSSDSLLLDSARHFLVKAAERNHEHALTLLTRTNELQYLYVNNLLVLYDSSGTYPDDTTFYPPVFLYDQVDLEEYLNNYVLYPYFAKVFGFRTSEVLLEYIVERDGHVGSVRVLAPGLLPEFAEEAARALLCLPLWSPGFQGNSAVRVRDRIPVTFIRDKDFFDPYSHWYDDYTFE